MNGCGPLPKHCGYNGTIEEYASQETLYILLSTVAHLFLMVT